MFGNSVARLAAQNVFQTRLRASFIMQSHEVGLGVINPPTGEGIDVNVSLVPRRNGHGCAIPFQKAFIDPVNVLNDGKLKVQPWVRGWIADWFAELRDDDLFGLVNGEEASEHDAQNDKHERDRQK